MKTLVYLKCWKVFLIFYFVFCLIVSDFVKADDETNTELVVSSDLSEAAEGSFSKRHMAAAVIIDTTAREPKFHGSVRLDLGLVSLEETGNLSDKVPVKEIIPKPKKTNVIFVLPSDITPEESKQLLARTQEKLSQNNPNASYVLKAVRIDISDLKDEIAMADKEMARFEALSNSNVIPAEHEQRKLLLEKLKKANQKLLRDFSTWAQSYRKNMRLLMQNPASQSLMFASAVGITTSTVPLATMVLSAGDSGMSPFLLLQCLQVVAYDQLNSAGSGKLLEFEMKHEFPFAKNNRMVRAYNSGTFAKAMSINFAVNFLNVMWWNQLSHWQNPDIISHPSYADIASGSVGVLAQAVATSLSDVGVATLRSKGYLSARSETLLLASLNLLNQMTNFSLARQATGLYWACLTAELATKASIALSSKILPARSDRIVLIHPELLGGRKESVAKFLADVNESVSVDGLTPEKITQLYGKDMARPNQSSFAKSLAFTKSMYQAVWSSLDRWRQTIADFYQKTCYGISNKTRDLKDSWKDSGIDI